MAGTVTERISPSDYYNSFVIHPMYVECLEVMTNGGKQNIWNVKGGNFPNALKRMQRFGMILERFVSPGRHFPVLAVRLLTVPAYCNRLPCCHCVVGYQKSCLRTGTCGNDRCHSTYVR